MVARIVGNKQKGRLQTGAAVLAAAKFVDTSLVAARLSKFNAAYDAYVDAQQQVEQLVAALRARRLPRNFHCRALARAVEDLACTLVGDGAPRLNPFKTLRVPSPSAMKRLPLG